MSEVITLIITAKKLGTGSEDDPFRPDTDYLNWSVIDEDSTQFFLNVQDTSKKEV